jgi:hypothetical protein
MKVFRIRGDKDTPHSDEVWLEVLKLQAGDCIEFDDGSRCTYDGKFKFTETDSISILVPLDIREKLQS